MALRSPVAGPRIVPYLEPRTAGDVLPNGRPAFRVTQRFNDPDAYFGGPHKAIDLGNFNCGDTLYASVSGYLTNRRDIYGALIVEIREVSGDVVGYGHLDRFARVSGTWVTRGNIIGYVGSTGLGNICHCHFYRIVNGVLVDPWPLLEQNAATFVNVQRGARIRAQPSASSALIKELLYMVRLERAGAIVNGGSYLYLNKNGVWTTSNRWRPVNYGGRTRYVILPFTKVI